MAEVGGRAVRCREYSDHACLSSGHVVAPQSHFTDPEGEPLNLLRDTTLAHRKRHFRTNDARSLEASFPTWKTLAHRRVSVEKR